MSGTSGVIIRLARPGDENEIARVHVESWRSTYKGIVPDEVLAGSEGGALCRLTLGLGLRPGSRSAGGWLLLARAQTQSPRLIGR